jgi:hypothetical protein
MRMQMVTATARLLWGVLQPGTYVAPVPKSVPEVDDVTFAVGLVLARLVYAAFEAVPGPYERSTTGVLDVSSTAATGSPSGV